MTSPDAATWRAGLADDDGGEWDETRWCPGCGQDRLLGMELVGGRVMGCCEFCWQRADYTPPEDDDGPGAGWSEPQTSPYYRVARARRM